MSTALTDDLDTDQGNQPPAGQEPAGEQQQPPQEVVIPQFSVGEDGKLSDGWYKSNLVPEEFRDSKPLQRIETIQGMVSSLANAQKMIGAPAEELVRIGEHVSDEDRAKLNRYLGIPESPDGYAEALKDWEAPRELGEDFVPDSEFLARAHEQGISPNQLQWIYSEYAQERSKIGEQLQGSVEQRLADVEKILTDDADFGGNKFDESMRAARVGFKYMAKEHGIIEGTPEYDALMNDLRGSSVLMKDLAKRGRQYMETDMVPGNDSKPDLGQSAEQRQQELFSEFLKLQPGDPRRAQIEKEIDAISRAKVAREMKSQGQ